MDYLVGNTLLGKCYFSSKQEETLQKSKPNRLNNVMGINTSLI